MTEKECVYVLYQKERAGWNWRGELRERVGGRGGGLCASLIDKLMYHRQGNAPKASVDRLKDHFEFEVGSRVDGSRLKDGCRKSGRALEELDVTSCQRCSTEVDDAYSMLETYTCVRTEHARRPH